MESGAWRLHISQRQVAVQGFCLNCPRCVADGNVAMSRLELNCAVNLLDSDVAALELNYEVNFTGQAQGEVYPVCNLRFQFGRAQANPFGRRNAS